MSKLAVFLFAAVMVLCATQVSNACRCSPPDLYVTLWASMYENVSYVAQVQIVSPAVDNGTAVLYKGVVRMPVQVLMLTFPRCKLTELQGDLTVGEAVTVSTPSSSSSCRFTLQPSTTYFLSGSVNGNGAQCHHLSLYASSCEIHAVLYAGACDYRADWSTLTDDVRPKNFVRTL